jgi:hypothetical protein
MQCVIDQKNNLLIYQCPHCHLETTTLISELACCIFRHGYNTQTQIQVSPHECKEQCDIYAQDPIYVGCCKPYRIIVENIDKDNSNSNSNSNSNIYLVAACEYI